MSEPVKVSDAARALEVDRGTVYRYVREGAIINHGTPDHPRVVIEEARAAGVGFWGRRRRLMAGAEPIPGAPDDAAPPEPVLAGAPPAALAAPELVGVNEAARRLGLNPSTVSRQLHAGIIPNRGTVGRPLIEVDEARQAREIGLDRSKRRGPEAPAAPPEDHPSPLDRSSSVTTDNETFQSARARRERAAAERAEIELAQLRGGLMRVDAATREWSAALESLLNAMAQFVDELPVKLGLGREAVELAKREWREFRRRQADQAAAGVAAAQNRG